HTLLQKLFYFLEYARGKELGYRYRLYHYGPYCPEVWADLSYLEDIGAVAVVGGPNGFGYHIHPQGAIQALLRFTDEDLKKEVNSLLDFLGRRPVRELECLATTHYVYKELQFTQNEPPPTWEAVVKGVRALKPHLSEAEVQAAWMALQGQGLVEVTPGHR
ncbi:MAG: hypothetical protein QHH27_11355, partial [Clostridia bacterium]|nr:hypothetical protein [Clostridia bacterium]